MELCKASNENTTVTKHLMINDKELKDKTKVSIISKIAYVIEEELASMRGEDIVISLPWFHLPWAPILSYLSRVAKRRRLVGNTPSETPGHPHPSFLQPIQSGSQDISHAVLVPMQSVLTQETLATLSNTITAAVASALQNVAQAPSSASAAIPVVQFIPDPPQGSGTAVHGSSDIAETTPPTGNADQSVQHTVDTAVQQVMGSLLPCAVTSPSWSLLY
ncbi:hypothetical protein ACROYT_G001258 [Oculina patagonica]